MAIHQPQSRSTLAKFHGQAPEITGALRAIGQAVAKSELEPRLLELVKLRASQLNGCAFCLNMHWQEAQKHGETAERLNLLAAWREAPVFTDRERAALAWAEALTLIAQGPVSDAVYEEARQHFSENELTYLSAAIVQINAWNRLAVAYRWTPEVGGAA